MREILARRCLKTESNGLEPQGTALRLRKPAFSTAYPPSSATDSCEIILPCSKVTQIRRDLTGWFFASMEASSRSWKQPSMSQRLLLLWIQISYCSWRIMGNLTRAYLRKAQPEMKVTEGQTGCAGETWPVGSPLYLERLSLRGRRGPCEFRIAGVKSTLPTLSRTTERTSKGRKTEANRLSYANLR